MNENLENSHEVYHEEKQEFWLHNQPEIEQVFDHK